MGHVNLPSVDDIQQQKDPKQQMEMLINTLGILMKELGEINGYLTTSNVKELHAKVIKAGTITAEKIQANTITAEKMSVSELSAITANLGHITAGIIRGIQIYGSYIATAEGTYPRAEMDSLLNQIGAFFNATNWIKMLANLAGTPLLQFSAGSGSITTSIGLDTTSNRLRIICNRGIEITPFSDGVHFPSWSQIINDSSGQNLQTVLNTKANSFSGFTGTVYCAATPGGSPTVAKTFSDGVCTS